MNVYVVEVENTRERRREKRALSTKEWRVAPIVCTSERGWRKGLGRTEGNSLRGAECVRSA